MTPLSKLERLIDEAFHSVILEFDPRAPDVYRQCVNTLNELEGVIESSMAAPDAKRSLFVRVKSHLALMASEVKNYAEAERLTAVVLKLASVDDPDFALVVSIRAKSLHALGRHEEEITEGLDYAKSEGVTGQALVHLLAQLVRRHPASMKRMGAIMERVKAYISKSPELAGRMERFSLSAEDPGEYILSLADVVRQISMEEAAHALGETE